MIPLKAGECVRVSRYGFLWYGVVREHNRFTGYSLEIITAAPPSAIHDGVWRESVQWRPRSRPVTLDPNGIRSEVVKEAVLEAVQRARREKRQGVIRLFKVEAYGMAVVNGGYKVPDIDLFMTHARDMHLSGYTGQGVVVAIVDSGVDTSDPEVMSHVVGGINMSAEDGPSDIHDYVGHGNIVAKLILAHAPDAQLYVVKVFGRRPSCEDRVVVAGLREAFRHAKIANASLGGSGSLELKALMEDIDCMCDATLVAAAGNSGDGRASTGEPEFPGAYDFPITVGAVDRGGLADAAWDWLPLRPSAFSSSYPAVDCVAVGRVPGTWDMGTSFAAPIVTALLALKESKDLAKGMGPLLDSERYLWLVDRCRQLPGLDSRNDQTGYGLATMRADCPLRSISMLADAPYTIWIDGVEVPWAKTPENRPPGEIWFYGREFAEKSGRRVSYDPNDPRGPVARYY